MFLGKVIGNVWATKKYEAVHGFRFLCVVPLDTGHNPVGDPFFAVDTVGAGPGELVLYITASEAVIPLPVDLAPVDASIVAIVDSLYAEH